MRWPAPKPPTIYQEAPTKGDYAVSVTIAAVGLGAVLLGSNPFGENPQSPAARLAEEVVGLCLFATGACRVGEKAIHSMELRSSRRGVDDIYARISFFPLSCVQYMPEIALGEEPIHPRTRRIYVVPKFVLRSVPPTPEPSMPRPPIPPAPPLPPAA